MILLTGVQDQHLLLKYGQNEWRPIQSQSQSQCKCQRYECVPESEPMTVPLLSEPMPESVPGSESMSMLVP